MTALMVSPFPPYRDGIAAYAVQELRALRRADTKVDVLSPLPSAAPMHLPLGGAPGMAMLARRAVGYDRLIIQFSPEMLFGRCHGPAERVAVWMGLLALTRLVDVDVRLHELEYGPIERNPAERRAAATALRAAARVTVHTEAEREALRHRLGAIRSLQVIQHGRDFTPATDLGPDEARAALGLPDHPFVFLTIGFLQEHKGFDQAIEAMGRLGVERADAARRDPARHPHLYVVGSARVDHPEISGYVDRLRRLCDMTPQATLREGYVSDERFDLWLRAADAVILPYREIWSSGVLERARLFDLPVIASDLPQLRDQVPPGTELFADLDELEAAMSRLLQRGSRPIDLDAVGAADPGSPGAADDDHGMQRWDVDEASPDRRSVQAQVVARARAGRLAEEAVGVAAAGRPVDGLLAIGPLHRPSATSARPGVSGAKRLIRRVIDWRIEPVAAQVEELQRATLAAVAELDRRSELDRESPRIVENPVE